MGIASEEYMSFENNVIKDWDIFLSNVAVMIQKNYSSEEISKIFLGMRIELEATVSKINLNEEFAAGVGVRIAPGFKKIDSKFVLVSKYLFLNVDQSTRKSWIGVKVGDFVKFQAFIEGGGVFPAIEISKYENDPEIMLMPRLILGECLHST